VTAAKLTGTIVEIVFGTVASVVSGATVVAVLVESVEPVSEPVAWLALPFPDFEELDLLLLLLLLLDCVPPALPLVSSGPALELADWEAALSGLFEFAGGGWLAELLVDDG